MIMKIIRTDNYDDEGPRGTQHVVRENLDEATGRRLIDELNDDSRRSDYDWFRLVPDDYKLFVFEP
jgi:hypothetical protein